MKYVCLTMKLICDCEFYPKKIYLLNCKVIIK